MTRSQPQQVAAALLKEINEFLNEVTHTDSYDKVVFANLISQSIELQGKGGQVAQGCLLRASLYSGTGNFVEAEKMFRNVENNTYHAEARSGRVHHLVNHGYASEAMQLMDLFFDNRVTYNFVDIAILAISAGGFNAVVEKLEESQRNQEVLKMTSTVLDLSRRGAEVLRLLGVRDAQVSAMLDVAGGILRDNKLYWQDEMPDITVVQPEQGGPALAFEYRVYVTPEKAAQMTWDLTESLVNRELECSNIAIGFLGTRLQARLVA